MIETPNFKKLLKEQYPMEMNEMEQVQQKPIDESYPLQSPQNPYSDQQQYVSQEQEYTPEEYREQLPTQANSQKESGYERNPFEMDSYNNNVPEQPLSYGGSMADGMLSDNEVPEHIRRKFWFVFHKDNILTFLDPDRKMSKLLNFDITKIDILNTIPYYDYTFEKELTFDILRNVFETKLDRALGYGKGASLKNERIILQSQFTEQRQINENSNEGGAIQGNFFKRLMGRR